VAGNVIGCAKASRTISDYDRNVTRPDNTERRNSLLHRIHRRFQTVTETIRVGDLELEFTRIADPDRVLDEVAEREDLRERLGERREGDQLHLPYWAELWESALGIGKFLQRRWKRQKLNVLDLGCGMGLAGTVAAALGCNVTFADLEPEALLFARLNSLPDSDRVRTHRLNWRTDRLTEKFDLIIGADIIYERAQWEHLDTFWKAHLERGGTIILGEPGRQTGETFLPWIRERGWRTTEFEEPIATRPKPIRILELAQKESTAC
jgi:predicted nicotinamide N-methyase